MINEIGKSIENGSFQIIRKELGPTDFSQTELAVAVRVIHATGDFEYANNLRFSSTARADGCRLLRQGCPLITDVHMVQAGISDRFLRQKSERVRCLVDDPAAAQLADESGMTHAAAAIRLQKTILPETIVAIGNAPTALLELIRLAYEENITPGLVIGVPVGFVNAAESKAMLAESRLSFITSLGRKGGSPVAAAIVNALGAME